MTKEKKTTPLFSVVMPIHGVEKYLKKSIESVLNQTFLDYELILVDDQSPDNCPKICDDYAAVYPNIKVIHQENQGLSGARNAGFYKTVGEYVYFLDGDDIIAPDTLSYFHRVIKENPSVTYFFSDFYDVYGESLDNIHVTDNGYEILSRNQIQEAFLKREVRILAPGAMLNGRWLKDSKLLFEKNPFGEDQLFIWKALLRVNNVVHIKKQLYYYIHREGSIMTASAVNKITQAYPFFCDLELEYKNAKDASPFVKEFLLPFWVRGILHSTAKILSFSNYKTILVSFEAGMHMKKLRDYPSMKIKCLAYVYQINKRLFYWVNRKY